MYIMLKNGYVIKTFDNTNSVITSTTTNEGNIIYPPIVPSPLYDSSFLIDSSNNVNFLKNINVTGKIFSSGIRYYNILPTSLLSFDTTNNEIFYTNTVPSGSGASLTANNTFSGTNIFSGANTFSGNVNMTGRILKSFVRIFAGDTITSNYAGYFVFVQIGAGPSTSITLFDSNSFGVTPNPCATITIYNALAVNLTINTNASQGFWSVSLAGISSLSLKSNDCIKLFATGIGWGVTGSCFDSRLIANISSTNSKVAIGFIPTTQVDNTTIINASGSNVNASTASAFYVAPIRNNNITSPNILSYDTSTKEVYYSTSPFAFAYYSNSAAQTITSTVLNFIKFPTVSRTIGNLGITYTDSDGFFTNSSGQTILINVNATWGYENNSSGQRHWKIGHSVLRNLSYIVQDTNTNSTPIQSVSYTFSLLANENFYFVGFQDSGVSLATIISTTKCTILKLA